MLNPGTKKNAQSLFSKLFQKFSINTTAFCNFSSNIKRIVTKKGNIKDYHGTYGSCYTLMLLFVFLQNNQILLQFDFCQWLHDSVAAHVWIYSVQIWSWNSILLLLILSPFTTYGNWELNACKSHTEVVQRRQLFILMWLIWDNFCAYVFQAHLPIEENSFIL